MFYTKAMVSGCMQSVHHTLCTPAQFLSHSTLGSKRDLISPFSFLKMVSVIRIFASCHYSLRILSGPRRSSWEMKVTNNYQSFPFLVIGTTVIGTTAKRLLGTKENTKSAAEEQDGDQIQEMMKQREKRLNQKSIRQQHFLCL